MKDKQIKPSGSEPRIFLVSAILHCVAMTALVYLRSSFGFAYLSPKSVFFTFSWMMALFTIYAWIESSVWPQFRVLCIFGIGAVALYWLHLLSAFVRELYRKGEHDHYSGRSHPIRLMRRTGRMSKSNFEMNLHLWAEPAMVILTAFGLRILFGEQHLSLWLFFVAVCLWFKEAFNYWHHLRLQKHHEDIFEDAGDTVEPSPAGKVTPEPPKATRTGKVKRERKPAETRENEEENRAAELLRLLPPYSLEDAERNYHALIKMSHPDANEGTAESTERTAKLNDAIEFLRKKLDA